MDTRAIEHRDRRGTAYTVVIALLAALATVVPTSVSRAETPDIDIVTYTDPAISAPRGISVGPDGALWFTNLFGDTIGRITTEGTITSYSDPAISGAQGITAGPDGALWFTNGASIGRITTTGTVTTYTDPAMGFPSDITAGSDGALWFNNGSSIGRITTTGAVTTYTDPAISNTTGITAGSDGALWFVNLGSIGRITTSGTVTTYAHPAIVGPGKITAGPDGALWLTQFNLFGPTPAPIVRITTSGTVTTYTDPAISGISGLTAGPDGALWFGNGFASIGRITTAGTVTTYTDPAITGIAGLTTGPDGALWFTNGMNSIGRAAFAAVAPAGEGLLRVTTEPPVPSTVTADGVPMAGYGLSWVSVPAGDLEVCFTDVPGFSTPPCEMVTVDENQTTMVEGTFAQQGTLAVSVQPAGLPSTIYVDGEPMDRFGLLTYLDAGTYDVCFGAVDGWGAPTCESAVVSAGATTPVTGVFTEGASGGLQPDGPAGLLRVTTDPPLPGSISVGGVVRGAWGLSWPEYPVGEQEVCFTDVPGYATPPCETVNVTDGSTTTLQGTYTPLGLVQVSVDPAGLPTNISVDGIARDRFGLLGWFPAGTVTVCVNDIDDYLTPECADLAITPGDTVTHSFDYMPIGEVPF